jgi:hypothetical protein
MARPLEHPETLSDRSPRVDWSVWADGQWWRLTQGPDFPQDPFRALRALRSWGTRNGRRISGAVSGTDTMDIKITER